MAKYKIIPSSRTIMQSPISIGHKAEKGVEAIEFDLTAWVETYGSGTLTVIMRRWGDAIPYPIALEIDENNKATWTLSDTDTAKAGMAYAQLNYIVGETVVKKSDIYTFRVMDSLTGEGEPPEAYESWLEHLTHFAAEAMAEVLDIEGIVTDKTLTVDGGIADAKAAGDALALKADKSTTYTKTEVDQMIEDVEVETDTTLSVSGKPADAAETGRQFGLIKADLGEITEGTKPSNLADINKIEIGKAWNGENNVNRAVLYIPVDPSTEYTLSFDSISGFDSVYWFEKASKGATALLVDHQLASAEETRTTTANSTYFIVQFNKNNIVKSDFDNINLRFIKTNDVSTFTAVDDVARERISKISEDINLADINNVEVGIAWNGVVNTDRAVLYIPVEPSTEYTLSLDSISGFDSVYWFEKASKGATALLVDHQLASAEETRTTTENSTYFVLQFNKTNVTRAELIGLNVWFVKKGEGQNLTAVDSVARKEIGDIKEKGIGGIFIDYNDIPTIAITVDGRLPQSKEDGDVDAYVQYKGNGNVFSDYCTLKVQGQSSQHYPKKNYTIKLYTNSARTKKDKRVFRDWEKSSKYVMKANWVDHSHARNIVNARLWSQIMKSRTDFDSLPDTLKNSHLAIDGFPIKVFANGVYQGLYTWNIPKSGMYGLDDEINTNALMYGDDYHYTGALIWRAASDQNNQWSDETHDEKPAIIKTGWDRVLSFVYTSSDADFVSQFSNYFDKQSVIDQYIFIYAGCIVDNLAKNQTFFTYDANKWYGGMYDMDGTWGCPPYPPVKATWYDYNTAFQSGYTVSTDGRGATNYLYERVGNLFAEDIKTRYQELRQDVLSESNIDAEFDRFMGVIPPYLYAEDYATTTGDGAFIDIPLKDSNDAIQVRQFVKARLEYVDSMIIGQKNLANINKIEIGKAWNGENNVNRAVLYIPVDPSTEYTLSFDSISGFDSVYWFEKASKGATALLVDHQLASAEETRTTTENSTYFIVQFNKNNIVKSDFDNINMRFVKTTD